MVAIRRKDKEGDFPLENFAMKKVKDETGLEVKVLQTLGVFHYIYESKENRLVKKT